MIVYFYDIQLEYLKANNPAAWYNGDTSFVLYIEEF